jgi:hypothetical protein
MACWNLWLLMQCCMHAYVSEVESCDALLESVAADAVLHACICLVGSNGDLVPGLCLVQDHCGVLHVLFAPCG